MKLPKRYLWHIAIVFVISALSIKVAGPLPFVHAQDFGVQSDYSEEYGAEYTKDDTKELTTKRLMMGWFGTVLTACFGMIGLAMLVYYIDHIAQFHARAEIHEGFPFLRDSNTLQVATLTNIEL